MHLRWRGDEHRIELLLGEHPVEVVVALQAGVLGQHVGEIAHRVAAGHQVDLRMRSKNGQMGQAHLAQADHRCLDHGLLMK